MGHSNATVTVPITDSNRNAKTSDIVATAVRKWYTDEADRYDDARSGHGLRTKAMLPHQTGWYIEDHDRDVASHSLVIPVVTDTLTVEKTVKVTVPGELLTKLGARGRGYQGLREILVKEYGEAVADHEVLALPKPRKAVAAATEGKAVTTYNVISDGRVVGAASSQAEARQKAVDFLNTHPTWIDATVEAVVSRDTGNKALVRVTRPVPETGTVTVKLKLTTARRGAVPSEYLVVFDYHH